MPRLPHDARVLGHPHSANARAGDRALARGVGRDPDAGAAQADRADGNVESAGGREPPDGRGSLQRAPLAAGELARAFSTTRRWLKQALVCTYHLRPFAAWARNSSLLRNRRSRPTSRARSVASRARATISKATNTSFLLRWATCSSSPCPRSTT